jgi:hypothetical protein
VYTVLTLGLAQKLHSSFLNVLGAIYMLLIFMMFTAIAARTIWSFGSGSMFQAPCLNEPLGIKQKISQNLVQQREVDPEVNKTLIGHEGEPKRHGV